MDKNDFQVISGNEPDSNILGLATPNTNGCMIWRYQAGHSMMLIRIETGKDTFFFLTFEYVRYYEGPFSWIGANLEIGTETEKSQLLRKLGNDDFMDRFHLYKIMTSNKMEIKIVALKGILKSEDIPLSFQGMQSQSEDS